MNKEEIKQIAKEVFYEELKEVIKATKIPVDREETQFCISNLRLIENFS